MATNEPREFSAYEDTAARRAQWGTDGGVYMGFTVEPPADEAHILREPEGGRGWMLIPHGDGWRKRTYGGDRHILTIGPNGSGKSRRLLIPALYFLKNWSICAIDPKGELFANTAIHRAKTPGHKVVLIDPFEVVKKTYPHLAGRVALGSHGFDCESQGFNPMASLDPKSPRFVDDCKALATALIKTEGEKSGKDSYWTEAAKALVKGIIMGLTLEAEAARAAGIVGAVPSLVKLRETLGQTPEVMAENLAAWVDEFGPKCPPLRASLGEFVTHNSQDRELGGIRRQAKVQTDWLDSAEVTDDLKKSPAVDLSKLKETPITIYLVLPPEFLASHGTWLRLMVTCLLRPLLREIMDKGDGSAPVPVLFMLDEFAQLGHMEIIKDNYALMRGYGVKLWTVWQDLNQAKMLYGDWWETFIGNAGQTQSFAPQDMTTRKYLSELGGELVTWHTREAKSGGLSFSRGGPSLNTGGSTSDTNLKEPIMYPHELAQMGRGQSVVFTQNGLVLRSYFPDATHPEFAGVKDMMAEAAAARKPCAE